MAVNFFRRKRNLALGITALNRIGGEALNIQLITLIAGVAGWRAAYRALGLVALPLAIPLALIMRKRPEDIGLLPDGDTAERATGAGAAASASRPAEFDWRAGEVVFTSAFWCIVWAEFLAVSTTAAVGFQLAPFLSDAGLSQTAAAAAITAGVLLGGLSVPLWGHLSDKSGIKRLTLIALGSTAAATLAFTLLDARQFGFYITIAWGIASGAIPVIGSMMVGNYFGRASFGALTGLTGPFRTAGDGLGAGDGGAAVQRHGRLRRDVWRGARVLCRRRAAERRRPSANAARKTRKDGKDIGAAPAKPPPLCATKQMRQYRHSHNQRVFGLAIERQAVVLHFHREIAAALHRVEQYAMRLERRHKVGVDPQVE